MEEWDKAIEDRKNGKRVLSFSEKISLIIAELEQEREKPAEIQIREKEVIKLEPKCAKCKEKEYTSKLGQLKMITYGALAYSIIITVISIVKNDLVKSDFRAFIEQVWGFLCLAFEKANLGIVTLSEHINNEIAQKIIHIGLWVVIAGLVIFGIYKLYNEMQYKTWKFWNIGAVAMVLVDLILIIYLSEPIKNLLNINLFYFAFMVYAGYIIIRIIVNFIKGRSL